MLRLRPLILAGVLFIAATPAFAATSHVKTWTALGNDLYCGVAIHQPGKPPTQLLCSASVIPPPPHGVGFGDPGFVFLAAHGRPTLARLSQDTLEGSTPVALSSGQRWSDLGITCTISTASVRCVNRSAHGFTHGDELRQARVIAQKMRVHVHDELAFEAIGPVTGQFRGRCFRRGYIKQCTIDIVHR